MTQSFLQIAQDEKADAELIANLNHTLVRFGKEREFEENDLSDLVIANDLLQLLRPAEQRHSHIVDLIVVGNQTNRAQTNLGFTLEPLAELRRALA